MTPQIDDRRSISQSWIPRDGVFSSFRSRTAIQRMRIFMPLGPDLGPGETRQSANHDVQHAVPNRGKHLAREDPIILLNSGLAGKDFATLSSCRILQRRANSRRTPRTIVRRRYAAGSRISRFCWLLSKRSSACSSISAAVEVSRKTFLQS